MKMGDGIKLTEYNNDEPQSIQESRLRQARYHQPSKRNFVSVIDATFKPQKKKEEIHLCSICHSRLEYKRLPDALPTEDSHKFMYCFSCDEYSLAQEIQDRMTEEQVDVVMLRQLKDQYK